MNYIIVHFSRISSDDEDKNSRTLNWRESFSDRDEAVARMGELMWIHNLKKESYSRGSILISDNRKYQIILLQRDEMKRINF